MTLFHSNGSYWLAVFLLGWTVFEAIWDWRDQDLPVWLSFVPLTLCLIYRGVEMPVVAILMGISVFSTELPRGILHFFVVAPALMVLVFDISYLPLIIGWLTLYVFWVLGWVGSADALAGVNLLLAFPDLTMLISIFVGIIAWGMSILFIDYGRKSLLRFWVTITSNIPSKRRPGMGAYAIAMSIFVAMGYF